MRGLLFCGVLLSGCVDEATDTGSGTNTSTRQAFSCGELTCDPDQFCEELVPGVKPETGSVASSFACTDAPAACSGVPTCACVSGEAACATDCDESGDGVHCTLYAP